MRHVFSVGAGNISFTRCETKCIDPRGDTEVDSADANDYLRSWAQANTLEMFVWVAGVDNLVFGGVFGCVGSPRKGTQ